MPEVYGRVLPSRSVPTLVALSLLAVMLFTIKGLLDAIRSRVLVRIGAVLGANVSERVVQAVMRLPQRPEQRTDGLQPIRDIDAIRGRILVHNIDFALQVDERAGESVYEIRVRIDKDEAARAAGGTIIPGMPVEVFVKTSDSKAISLLVKPLTDQLHRAFRED